MSSSNVCNDSRSSSLGTNKALFREKENRWIGLQKWQKGCCRFFNPLPMRPLKKWSGQNGSDGGGIGGTTHFLTTTEGKKWKMMQIVRTKTRQCKRKKLTGISGFGKQQQPKHNPKYNQIGKNALSKTQKKKKKEKKKTDSEDEMENENMGRQQQQRTGKPRAMTDYCAHSAVITFAKL